MSDHHQVKALHIWKDQESIVVVEMGDPQGRIPWAAQGLTWQSDGLHFKRMVAVPEPEAIVFDGVATLKNGGEDPSHQGYCWTIGKGRMFYFQPGHETNPIFYDANIRKIMANAVAWAAP